LLLTNFKVKNYIQNMRR